MPPFLPRKRLRDEEPEAGPSKPLPKTKGGDKSVTNTPRKATLFDDLDGLTRSKITAESSKAFLKSLAATDDEESLSSLSEDEFEDVPPTKRQKTIEQSADEEDEDIEFEDVHTAPAPRPVGPPPSGDLELTLTKETRVSLTNPLGTKKGPSNIERGIRTATHKMHVQLLMWHNALRNAWLCDKEVQAILISKLSPHDVEEVEQWRRKSGLQPVDETPKKGKGKEKDKRRKKLDPRSQRDWGEPAELTGEVDMSRGDPLLRLLDHLKRYWRAKFRITAPGLRKLGYMSLQRLDEEIKSFEKGKYDPERHGERFRNLEEFRQSAKDMAGSRDVGAQLFTALLRGIGLEARMVANLQPVGFGWSQIEEAEEKNRRALKKKQEANTVEDNSSDLEEESEDEQPAPKPATKGKAKAPVKPKTPAKTERKPRKRKSLTSGLKGAPIDLSEFETSAASEVDDESVIDVTPARPRRLPSLPYDTDLSFPHYWTEVLSPVTNTYTSVDPVVLNIVANSPIFLERFEPRGVKVDKAKQVTSYIIGFSPDGTAKDVTTRYLKRHVWPGRTKGNRITVEKVPVRGRHGKVKRYEMYDWFTYVMSDYVRGWPSCPRTEIDDHEEATDLKPVKPVKKEIEEGKETLQSYKASTEFVLERHLKREEALVSGAKHVKLFTVKGKGDETIEEKVYRRKDVVSCKSMETWHKEGRAPKDGEEPLKRVPYRAATTNRRRELAEAELASGGKVLQGLYSRAQTDWIIPPPIQNGIIPKNSFGNIDLYVDSMLPEGAAHIPRRGTMKICRRLGIDFAEAVVGFEFGHRMAVPIINGVVVAEENYDAVMDEWEIDEAERARKEKEKKMRTSVGMWRKFLMGMRIIKRVREEYGDMIDQNPDALNPFTNHSKKTKKSDEDTEAQAKVMVERDEEMAGGFLPEGHNEDEAESHNSSTFFPITHADYNDDDDDGGGFVIENHDEEPAKPIIGQAYATPQSLQSTKTREVSEEDQEIKAAEFDVEASPLKKRGRPSGSTNKTPKTKFPAPAAKSKAPAKRVAQKNTPASRSTGKRKPQMADSEEEDEVSSLSELESGSKSEVEPAPKKLTKVAGRRATMPAKSARARITPRRSAARKSENAVRSHYFEHNDEDDDDE